MTGVSSKYTANILTNKCDQEKKLIQKEPQCIISGNPQVMGGRGGQKGGVRAREQEREGDRQRGRVGERERARE